MLQNFNSANFRNPSLANKPDSKGAKNNAYYSDNNYFSEWFKYPTKRQIGRGITDYIFLDELYIWN